MSGLYIHVPFCARRCSYCDFSIAVRPATPMDEYLTALRQEIALQPALSGAKLDTVYLGGGTPSRLGGEGVSQVLTIVRDSTAIAEGAEITIEANPDDVNDIAVARWASSGVNRVSLGAQSFDDSVLPWMRRTHDASRIDEAIVALRRGGIGNVSIDLIFSLPKELDRDWRQDLERALALEPEHVSLYGLTIEQHTPLGRWRERGISVEGSEERYEEEFLLADEMLVAAGFEHYEVSNFGLRGKHSRHNSSYWTGAPYFGVGPSAHSFDGHVRRWNVSAYAAWVRRLANGSAVIEGEEYLSPQNQLSEEVYLGLRTSHGLAVASAEEEVVRRWSAQGWAIIEGRNVRLTPLGWLRLDALAADLAARRGRAEVAA